MTSYRDSNLAHLRMRYNQLRNTESQKDVLLEDLLERCCDLQARNDSLSRESAANGIDFKSIAEQLTDMLNRQTFMVSILKSETL